MRYGGETKKLDFGMACRLNSESVCKICKSGRASQKKRDTVVYFAPGSHFASYGISYGISSRISGYVFFGGHGR